MFNYTTLLKTSLISISRHKSRSLLTMLGVIIGVLSVILLTSIGNGIRSFVTTQFESMGSNIIYVTPGEIITEEGGFSQSSDSGIINSKLKEEDAERIARLGPPIALSVPMTQSQVEVRYGTKKRNSEAWASSATYQKARNVELQSGRFYTKAEENSGKKVAVIGDKIYEKLFNYQNPVGKEITINKVKFTVIGVTEKEGGSFGGPGFDDIIYIPLTTAKNYLEMNTISSIIVSASSKDEIPAAIRGIQRVMLQRLDDKDFSVLDQNELMKTVDDILGTLTAGLAGIAAISLVVGGIGIMNIMLVSVTERTKEIGLRKAVGATPNTIMLQFLLEAGLLSSIGGLIGIGLGFLFTLILDRFIPSTITISSVMLAFGVSFAVGLIFGVLPARRASKLSPIEALRYE